VPSSGDTNQAPSLTTDGFTFSSSHFHTIDSPGICTFGGCVSDGSIYLAVDGFTLGQPITMTKAGGGAFSLLGADFAQLFLDGASAAAGGFPNADIMTITGSNGATVNLSPLSLAFATFAAVFNNVTSVTFEGFGVTGGADFSFAMDNVVVSSGLPEPSTWAMMLVGFASLGFAWRYRASRRSVVAIA
jgi:PEP-CTERM motif